MIYEFVGGPRCGERIEGKGIMRVPCFLYPEIGGVRLRDAYVAIGSNGGHRGNARGLIHKSREIAVRQPPLSPEVV